MHAVLARLYSHAISMDKSIVHLAPTNRYYIDVQYTIIKSHAPHTRSESI